MTIRAYLIVPNFWNKADKSDYLVDFGKPLIYIWGFGSDINKKYYKFKSLNIYYYLNNAILINTIKEEKNGIYHGKANLEKAVDRRRIIWSLERQIMFRRREYTGSLLMLSQIR